MPGAAGLVINVVAANVAQVLMSLVYFFYNGLFTTMALATEWADFARERKGLRVSSDPVGFQRAAYFLQLPYRYAVPLIVVSGVMHWLVSQSVFLVYLEAFVPTTVRVPPIFQANTLSTPPLPNSIAASASTALLPPLPVNHLITFGWSPKALTVLLALSFFILLTLVAVGWRRLPTGMPLAGSCSLAIAAACHGPEVEARGWMRPLQWGAVEDVNMVSSNAGMLASRKTTASFGGGSGRKGAPGGTETTEKGLARMGFGAASGVNFSLPGTAGAKAMRVGATRDRPGHCAFSSRNVEYPVEGGWYI